MDLIKIRSNELVAKNCSYIWNAIGVKSGMCFWDAMGPKNDFCGWDIRNLKIKGAVDNGNSRRCPRF